VEESVCVYFSFVWFVYVSPGPTQYIFHTSMTRYSLFVLKVSLNTNKTNNHLHFNSLFPGGPGLADTGMSLFWILLELRMTEVVVTTGAVGCAKLQSICHHQNYWVLVC